MVQSIQNAFSLPDLRRRILFTLGILILYRLLANIPVPGVNAAALSVLSEQVSGNALIDTLNLLSGGAVTNFSVMAMGVYPYITASIIIQLVTPIIPYLDELSQEGESGRNRINKITYYLTIPMALLQAIGQINLIGIQFGGVDLIVPNFGFGSIEDIVTTVTILTAMTAGTMVAIWLGEQITQDGIGQGVSLIIFSGIVAQIPSNFARILAIPDEFTKWFTIISFIILTLVTSYVIVMIQEGQRRVPVQYGRRVRGRKTYQGQNTYIPLKVNTAGMIPIIFAQSLLAFPGLIAQIFRDPTALDPNAIQQGSEWVYNTFGTRSGFFYWFVYFWLVVGFTFFYTDVMVTQQRLHETLQRQGGFIPGIRPGKRTQEYIKKVVRRITFVGAFFLAIVAITPGIMEFIGVVLWPLIFGTELIGLEQSALVITGSGLIIVVGVVLDTMRQLEAQLLMRNYEGFIK
ncbi:MAG: preprotein translocase subunit SecY [Anaerolineae bacterium]|nr:preprotein translocase subunit SecY [Anaerolineae bacterium]